jgi:hypothetical protein
MLFVLMPVHLPLRYKLCLPRHVQSFCALSNPLASQFSSAALLSGIWLNTDKGHVGCLGIGFGFDRLRAYFKSAPL